MAKDDGGSAFPPSEYLGGMTLRDYFAGRALLGLYSFVRPADPADQAPRRFAQIAYEVADAMLAERAK